MTIKSVSKTIFLVFSGILSSTSLFAAQPNSAASGKPVARVAWSDKPDLLGSASPSGIKTPVIVVSGTDAKRVAEHAVQADAPNPLRGSASPSGVKRSIAPSDVKLTAETHILAQKSESIKADLEKEIAQTTAFLAKVPVATARCLVGIDPVYLMKANFNLPSTQSDFLHRVLNNLENSLKQKFKNKYRINDEQFDDFYRTIDYRIKKNQSQKLIEIFKPTLEDRVSHYLCCCLAKSN